MKKILTVVLTCIIALTSLSGAASAEMVGENGILGVITNADGEIVRYVPMPVTRQTYVDTGVTLEPGESFISYQYEPQIAFGAGMRFVGQSDGKQTTRNRSLQISIYQSASIGGDRYLVAEGYFSTNKEAYDSNDIINGVVDICCGVSQTRPYYNAKFTNVSAASGYFNIVVYMD